ncbi:hypothetical protein [Natrialba asiatica]|uniref:Coil containing protein n=1 Tax=Natrialba asiatica (strain ATCC 700177 / DSM 12278 / JCM 9576 / FERM P-10747 / NBRC 102637 / 172P1) TaxID=29540 RepID=M0AQG2_NATA1|nr:hypothetical protein [Natrialba asiatica]ELZ00790.1 hypothetical protein C481_11165 [Natrialba asiatica DSM 12278]
MSNNTERTDVAITNEAKLREIYKLVSSNINDIHNIRMSLRRINRLGDESSTGSDVDLDPLRTYVNEEGPDVLGEPDTLNYLLEECGVDPDDLENINYIIEENKRLENEIIRLRSRLADIMETQVDESTDSD